MIYLITFLLSFIMLITEILFTRLFSVVFWYHFTFLVVSLSLLGLSAGGVYVYLYSDKKFLKGRIYPQLILSTAYLAIALFICLLTFCHFPFSLNFSFYGFLRTFFVCVITAVPFFIFGVCFSLIFLHFSAYINKIYFANLIGSAAGCLLAVPVIYIFGVPDAIIAICCLLTLISFVLCRHYERSESAVKRPNILLAGFSVIFFIVILGIYFSLYGKGVFLNIAKGFYAIRRYEGAYGMLQPFSFYKDFLNGWFDKITYKTLRLFIVLLIINISFLYI